VIKQKYGTWYVFSRMLQNQDATPAELISIQGYIKEKIE